MVGWVDQEVQRRVDARGDERVGAAIDRGPVHRQLPVGVGTHRRPLAAVAREYEGCPGRGCPGGNRHQRVLLPLGQRPQCGGQFGGVMRPDHGPETASTTEPQQHRSHRSHTDGTGPVQVVGDTGRLGRQQLLGVSAEQDGYAAVGKVGKTHHATCSSGMATTTCALVPLMPNADTAARRSPPTAGHGV